MIKHYLDQYEDCTSLQYNVQNHPLWMYVDLAEIIPYIRDLANTTDGLNKKDFTYQCFDQLKYFVDDIGASTEDHYYCPIHTFFRLGYRMLGLVCMDIAYVYRLGDDDKYHPVSIRESRSKDDLLKDLEPIYRRDIQALNQVIQDTVGTDMPHHSYSEGPVMIDSGLFPFDLEVMGLYPSYSKILPMTFAISEFRLDLTEEVKHAWKTLLTEHDARQKLQAQRDKVYTTSGMYHAAITKIDKTLTLIDYLRYIYLDDIQISHLGMVIKSLILQSALRSNEILKLVSSFQIDTVLSNDSVYQHLLRVCDSSRVNQ